MRFEQGEREAAFTVNIGPNKGMVLVPGKLYLTAAEADRLRPFSTDYPEALNEPELVLEVEPK